MSGTRQKILDEQLSQTLAAEGRGEALDAEAEDAEPLMAKPAATGQAGRNPEAGRRDQKARRALRRRQTDSAGYAASSPRAVGPDVFRAQLRLSTGALRPS